MLEYYTRVRANYIYGNNRMLKLIKYLKGYWFKTISGPLFKLLEAVFELITPLVVAWIIDAAIPRGQAGVGTESNRYLRSERRRGNGNYPPYR